MVSRRMRSAVLEAAPEAETPVTEAGMLSVETSELIEEAPSVAEENISEAVLPSDEMLHEAEEFEAETLFRSRGFA